MRFRTIRQNVFVAHGIVEIDVDSGAWEAQPGNLDRCRLHVEDRIASADRMALEIDEDVDIAGPDFGHDLLIAEIANGDDIAPLFAVCLIGRQHLRIGMAKEGHFEAIPVMQFEHPADKLHRGMFVEKVGGEVTDTDLVTPRMGHLMPDCGHLRGKSRRVATSQLVQMLIAGPMEVEEGAVHPDEIRLA
ncbi:hypothetical protein D3C87_1504950 [compost metagenome]